MKPGQTLVNPITEQSITCVELSPELLLIENSFPAGGRPAPGHVHPGQEERIEVIEGAVRCTMHGRTQRLEKGDIVVIEAGTTHDIVGDDEIDGTVRCETRPALRTGELLETSFRLAEDGRVSPRTGVPGLLQLAVTLSEYDDVFRLTRPVRPLQVVLFALLAPLARARGLSARYR